MTKQPAYPPDYVSAKTLAYRLDCAESTVDKYVKCGLLPKPGQLGELVRWKWKDVEDRVNALLSNDDSEPDVPDPFDEAIERGEAQEISH